MNHSTLNKRFLCATAIFSVAVFLCGAVIAQAQTAKPVVIVTLSSVNDVLADVDFIGSLGGPQAQQMVNSQMVNGMLMGMTRGRGFKGLDETKPISFCYSLSDSGDFSPSVQIPVTNLKDVVDTLTSLKIVPPPQDEGGVMKFSAPGGEDVYVREQNGWAYLTQAKDAPLPSEDPMKLAAGLSPDYDLGVRVLLQNVPEDKKKSAVEQFRGLMEFAMAQQKHQANGDLMNMLNQYTLEQQMAMLEQFLKEADQITVGWKLDRTDKDTYLDFGATAVAGTPLDKCMKDLADAHTNFAGLIKPDAAVMFTRCGKNPQEEADQAVAFLDQVKTQAEEAIAKDQDLPDAKRDDVKKVLNEFIDVGKSTAKSGISDGGAVVEMGANKKLQVVAGGFVADGPALETAVKDLLELAKGEQEFNENVEITWDAGSYKDMHLHKLVVKLPQPTSNTAPQPNPEDEAIEHVRKVVGDTVEVYFAAGPKSAYLAAGKGSLDLLKSIADRSAAEPNKAVSPMQMSISLTPIADFIGSLDENNAAPAAMFTQLLNQTPGKDHITLTAKPISNGMSYRFLIEEGVLKSIGGAVMGQFAGGQPPMHGGQPPMQGGQPVPQNH